MKKYIYLIIAILCFFIIGNNVYADQINSEDIPNASYVIGSIFLLMRKMKMLVIKDI